jgi:hypothetical protein
MPRPISLRAAPEQLEDLLKRGKVVAGTNMPFGLAGLGASVKAGAPRPDISTIDAYKAVLLASKSVGFSRGCSGTHTQEGIDKLGIGEQMKSKIKLTGGGPGRRISGQGRLRAWHPADQRAGRHSGHLTISARCRASPTSRAHSMSA